MGNFSPSRTDGRSDRRVVFELAQDAEPETVFTHEELIEALSEGLDSPVPRQRVYRAVTEGNRTLLKRKGRYLAAVPGTGYRVLRSNEHLPVALKKKESVEKGMKRAAELLDYVDANPLTQVERALLEGNRIMFRNVLGFMKHSETRHDKSDALIAELVGRIEKLEQPT